MADIANNRDILTFERSELFFDRQHVEESLRRMFMGTVASIHDDCVAMFGKELGNSCPLMADDHDINLHGLDVAERIDERFALLDAGVGTREVHRVGRESLFGEFKARTRTGAVLEEKVHHRKAAKRRNLLDGTFQNFTELLGVIKDSTDILLGHALESKQVFNLKRAQLKPPLLQGKRNFLCRSVRSAHGLPDPVRFQP